MKKIAISAFIASAALSLMGCEQGGSGDNPPIELWEEQQGATSIQLRWVVHSHPIFEPWSCDLYRTQSDSTNWTHLCEYFPDYDEYEYTDSQLMEATSYQFQVRISTLFNRMYSNIIDFETRLNRPEQLSAVRVEENEILLRWADSSMVEDGYEVQRASSLEDNFRVVARLPADWRQYLDSELEESIRYTYRVRAKKGEKTSDWSDAVSG